MLYLGCRPSCTFAIVVDKRDEDEDGGRVEEEEDEVLFCFLCMCLGSLGSVHIINWLSEI